MSIRRSARKQSYTIIDNCVFNSNLSFRAMGLLTYLLSKPDNWNVSIAHLTKVTDGSAFKAGRDAVYATIKELEQCGFIQRVQSRDSVGKLGSTDYVVFDQPQHADLPLTDNPYTANPTLVNTDILVSTERTNNASTDASLNSSSASNDKKTKKTTQEEFINALLDAGVKEDIASEYLNLRKSKRLPLTTGVINLLMQEVSKADCTLNQALETCVLRGWGGFKASWLQNAGDKTESSSDDALAGVHYI